MMEKKNHPVKKMQTQPVPLNSRRYPRY